MAKKKKGAKTQNKAAKLSMQGVGNTAKQLGFLLIGVAGFYGLHQAYQKIRPAAVSPNTTPTTSGLMGVAITYAEPVILGVGAVILNNLAKSSFWKTVWLGGAIYAGAKILNNAGRDFFKVNLLGNIDSNDVRIFDPSRQIQQPSQPPRLQVEFPNINGTQDEGRMNFEYADMAM